MNILESGNPVQKRVAALCGNIQAMIAFLALAIGSSLPALAAASDDDVQTAWRLLDYVAVDYRGAVADRQVKSPQEFAEMTEFSSAVEAKMTALPASASRADLIAESKAFRGMVAGKAAPDEVAKAARALGSHLLKIVKLGLGVLIEGRNSQIQGGALHRGYEISISHI